MSDLINWKRFFNYKSIRKVNIENDKRWEVMVRVECRVIMQSFGFSLSLRWDNLNFIDFFVLCDVREWNLIIILFSCLLLIAEDHHVHFDTIKDDFESDHSNPVIQKGQQGKINVHLGFLQVKHRYRIELNIPADILVDYIDQSHKLVLKVDEAAVPNINCKLLTFKGDTTEQSQFYEAEIEFFAHKEKFLKEELKLLTSDDKSVKLLFSARVLGRGKGTPMLKNGVHLLGIEDDEESGE